MLTSFIPGALSGGCHTEHPPCSSKHLTSCPREVVEYRGWEFCLRCPLCVVYYHLLLQAMQTWADYLNLLCPKFFRRVEKIKSSDLCDALRICLVELALNKHKLASLLQKARRISLWETERAIRGKGPHFASYYLSVSQRHFPSFLSNLLLQSSHAHSDESSHLNLSPRTW